MTGTPGPPPRTKPGPAILQAALALLVLLAVASGPLAAPAAAAPAAAAPAPTEPAATVRDVILDTDIGDDIDDAFALALLLSSPELHVDFIATSFGDTPLRARLVGRFLRAAARTDIAVGAGPPTAPGARFSQSGWASAAPPAAAPDAVAAALHRLRAAPAGTVTLIALAPLTTVGAMIERDPGAFRRLARVVVMGGSIRRGYGRHAGETSSRPSDEYNVRCDPAGWRALLSSGVAIEIMPLDATEIALDAPRRKRLFAAASPLGPVLEALYREWARGNRWGTTPTLFDVVPVARLLRPSLCELVPLRIDVTGHGATRVVAGAPNASACLDVNRAAVLDLLEERLRRRQGR